MINSKYIDKIVATGGTYLGKLVSRAAAENLVHCLLELGGKNPTIVDSTAHIKKTCLKIS